MTPSGPAGVAHGVASASDRSLLVNGRDVMLEIKAEREKVFDFVRDVQEGRIVGHTGKTI